MAPMLHSTSVTSTLLYCTACLSRALLILRGPTRRVLRSITTIRYRDYRRSMTRTMNDFLRKLIVFNLLRSVLQTLARSRAPLIDRAVVRLVRSGARPHCHRRSSSQMRERSTFTLPTPLPTEHVSKNNRLPELAYHVFPPRHVDWNPS